MLQWEYLVVEQGLTGRSLRGGREWTGNSAIPKSAALRLHQCAGRAGLGNGGGGELGQQAATLFQKIQIVIA
jgi:hypothetical protein